MVLDDWSVDLGGEVEGVIVFYWVGYLLKLIGVNMIEKDNVE